MSRGRGRGRGRGRPGPGLTLSSLGTVGLKPGESLPPPILQPPPLFPLQVDRKPLKLSQTDVDKYMLTVKQELRQYMLQSPFYLKAESTKKEIQRYSDKYSKMSNEGFVDWNPDWNLFPKELQIKTRKRKRAVPEFKPQLPQAKRTKCSLSERKISNVDRTRKDSAEAEGIEVLETREASAIEARVPFLSPVVDGHQLKSRFDQLEKSEQSQQGEEEEGGEVAEEEEEYYDEEVEEEGTDYNLTYFDPGEDYAADEDDPLEEGPYYS